jgi:hypothetical protein
VRVADDGNGGRQEIIGWWRQRGWWGRCLAKVLLIYDIWSSASCIGTYDIVHSCGEAKTNKNHMSHRYQDIKAVSGLAYVQYLSLAVFRHIHFPLAPHGG